MYVRVYRPVQRGRRVFGVSSFDERRADIEYTVTYTRITGFETGWRCDCPDFTHNRSGGGVVRSHCKHIKLVRDMVKLAGGIANIPHDLELTSDGKFQRIGASSVKIP